MAYKVAKSEAPRLFAFIRRLQFSFDPFSTESTAVREAWRQLTSPALTAANPKCKIDVVSARGVAPAMEAEFVDGDKRPIVASGAAANLVAALPDRASSSSTTTPEGQAATHITTEPSCVVAGPVQGSSIDGCSSFPTLDGGRRRPTRNPRRRPHSAHALLWRRLHW